MNHWNPYTRELRERVCKAEGYNSVESFVEAINGGYSHYHDFPAQPSCYQGLGYDAHSAKKGSGAHTGMSASFTGAQRQAQDSKIQGNSRIRKILSVGEKNVKRNSTRMKEMHRGVQNQKHLESDSEMDDENLRWIKKAQ